MSLYVREAGPADAPTIVFLHAWNLEAPDPFTRTVRAWIADAPLPQELVTLKAREEK